MRLQSSPERSGAWRQGIGIRCLVILCVAAATFGSLAWIRAAALTQENPQPPASAKRSSVMKVDERTKAPVPRVQGAVNRIERRSLLDLEPGVNVAELILVARLVDVTETKIVHGGKTEQITLQYKLEPARVLKGVYARDELLMTGDDLGVTRYSDPEDQLEKGDLLLVLLGWTGANYFNCNSAATLGQSIPRLAGSNDPLLDAMNTLIQSAQAIDRSKKVSLLVDGLKSAKGRSAVPLLSSLRRRARLAALNEEAPAAVALHLESGSAPVREVTALALSEMLDAAPDGAEWKREVVRKLAEAQSQTKFDTGARVALFKALGSAGKTSRDVESAAQVLGDHPSAATFSEKAAWLRALANAGLNERAEEVNSLLLDLPYDSPVDVQQAAESALVTLDPERGAERLKVRIFGKYEAGHSIAVELTAIGRLDPDRAVPILVDSSKRILAPEERLALAGACEHLADARLVPVLGTLLDPRQPQVRYLAIEALRLIDTAEAASALWPHWTQEPQLQRKLQIAAFLGRHGFRDGYPLAMEHLSRVELRDLAIDTLVAIKDPRTTDELRRIWQSSQDQRWTDAAIRALGRMGEARYAPEFLALARDRANPFALAGLAALGSLGNPEVLPIVRELLNSRSDEQVIAAMQATGALAAKMLVDADDVRERMLALVADPEASPNVRLAAFEALVVLQDARLSGALETATRDARLESSELLATFEARLRQRTIQSTQSSGRGIGIPRPGGPPPATQPQFFRRDVVK